MRAFEANGFDRDGGANGTEVVIELGDEHEESVLEGEAEGFGEMGGEEGVGRDEGGEGGGGAERGAFVEF